MTVTAWSTAVPEQSIWTSLISSKPRVQSVNEDLDRWLEESVASTRAGLYWEAYRILGSSQVREAAEFTGRAADVQAAVTFVGATQRQRGEDLRVAQARCSKEGGYWSGTTCDQKLGAFLSLWRDASERAAQEAELLRVRLQEKEQRRDEKGGFLKQNPAAMVAVPWLAIGYPFSRAGGL